MTNQDYKEKNRSSQVYSKPFLTNEVFPDDHPLRVCMDFSHDPHERSRQFLILIILGIMEGQDKITKKFHWGLFEALKDSGLIYNDGLEDVDIEDTIKKMLMDKKHPTDKDMQNAINFYASAFIGSFPDLKGKTPPWKRFNYGDFYQDYLLILNELKNYPRKVRNVNCRVGFLKDHLPAILSKTSKSIRMTNISDDKLKGLINLPKKELVINLLAHLYQRKPNSCRKYLTVMNKWYFDYGEMLKFREE